MSDVLDVPLLATTFFTLFVIMDPPGTVPVFLALTSTSTAKERKRAALQATAVAFGVIAVFTVFGQYILDFLGISVPALQLAGGLLLLLVAMELLTGKAEEPRPAGAGKVNVALVPLGTPLLAGPGAIVAAMLAVQEADGSPGWLAIALAIIGVHVTLWLAMRFSLVVHRVLGDGGTTLVTRLAGLLLAAIAVQLMADAVFAFVAANT
ncbi:MarC family protein [Georgenia sunbinii]|uniref:MarC family protein n=1 Tax=Georgenia sunbinii TaxID=3117728 RepID=UPI002F26483D